MERREEELIQQYVTHDEELRALYAEHRNSNINWKSSAIKST